MSQTEDEVAVEIKKQLEASISGKEEIIEMDRKPLKVGDKLRIPPNKPNWRQKILIKWGLKSPPIHEIYTITYIYNT